LDTSSYAEVKIVRQSHDSVRKVIVVDLEYGNTVDGVWKAGIQPRSKIGSASVQGTDYNALVANSTPETSEKTYDAVKRGLYEFLLSKNVIGAGTLE
jgi:hypothetical protein